MRLPLSMIKIPLAKAQVPHHIKHPPPLARGVVRRRRRGEAAPRMFRGSRGRRGSRGSCGGAGRPAPAKRGQSCVSGRAKAHAELTLPRAKLAPPPPARGGRECRECRRIAHPRVAQIPLTPTPIQDVGDFTC
eukprot:gene10894-biopygen7798